MASDNSFLTNKLFLDRTHFPYGFARSGEFSTKQARLLEAHGHAYQNLENGTVEPINDEEREFLRYCRREKTAETDHEKVWDIYHRHVMTKHTYISMGGALHQTYTETDSDNSSEAV